MPQQSLPGTNIQMDLQGGQDYRRTFDTIFAITGGMYLSQLSDLVGIPGATLQNWIKRGFVANPVNKRYTRRQTCRIILIALLRHALPLEDIATLLSSINHNLADESDDLIDDSDLYLYFCDVVLHLPNGAYFDTSLLQMRIEKVTRPFVRINPAVRSEDLRQLNKVLLVLVMAYGASLLQALAKERLMETK